LNVIKNPFPKKENGLLYKGLKKIDLILIDLDYY